LKKKFLECGKIVNTHGVRGEIKIQPWSDSPQFLTEFENMYVDGECMRVLSARVHKNCVIVLFEGINDINAAMCLRNKTVCIDREDAKLPEGSFFLQDVYGITVFDMAGNELGKVSDVLILPAGNVYVVKGEQEHLIPAVDDFVKQVNIAENRMIVQLIEGM